MAQINYLTVDGVTKMNTDTKVTGDLQSTTLDGRSFLTASSKVTPSTANTGIVTEQYLYWALKQ